MPTLTAEGINTLTHTVTYLMFDLVMKEILQHVREIAGFKGSEFVSLNSLELSHNLKGLLRNKKYLCMYVKV